MGDILKAIHDDIEDYQALCKKYGEAVQTKQTAQGVDLPDCYGEHARSLEKREREVREMASQKKKPLPTISVRHARTVTTEEKTDIHISREALFAWLRAEGHKIPEDAEVYIDNVERTVLIYEENIVVTFTKKETTEEP